MRPVSSLLFSVPPLFSSLAQTLSGEIDCANHGLLSHSTDGSPLTIRPQAIVYPKTASDIKQVISFCREYGMPLTVCGNRTARTGGALGEGIVIDMTRHFNHIRQMNMMEHTITVDAGVSVKMLRTKLRGWQMEVPVLTSADDGATIGALIATKSATASSFHHGTMREWVEALTVVVDSGEEHRIADGITPSGRLLGIYQSIFPILTTNGPTLRAAKPETADDATGYCLWNTSIGPRQLLDQLVGSEGTLGIITTVTLRLVPHKPFARTTCIPIADPTVLLSCIEIAKHHHGEHMFLYDQTFANLAERYHAGLLPVFEGAAFVLLVTHYDTDKERLHATTRTFARALPGNPDTLIQTDDEKLIDRITESSFLYSLFDAYTGGTHIPITVGDGMIVPLQEYTQTLLELDAYLGSTGKLYTLTSCAGSGHISAVTLFDAKSPEYARELETYTQELCTIIAKHKGGLSAVSGDGVIRSALLSYSYNEATLEVFRKIKDAWDPRGILNPLKKVGATTDYVRKHLAKI